MPPAAYVFDAYGTLYNVHSVRTLATELCGTSGELVTQLWRLKQLEYTWLRGLMRRYEDFASVTRAALEFALTAAGITPTPALCEPLMDKYLALDLYPEALAALDGLAPHTLAILSNGSPAMLEPLVANTGLAGRFADIISVDRAKTYKPDPACYALVQQSLGVAPQDVLFVSSNGFDVAGARAFGFQVAWIDRGGSAPPDSPADMFRLLRGQAENLGHPADTRLARLTDLLH